MFGISGDLQKKEDLTPVEKAERKIRRAKKAKAVKHVAGKAATAAVNTAESVVLGILKAVGTVLLIILATSTLFVGIFSVYVKTCLTPTFDLTLEEQKLNESSTIWYEDPTGQWKELVNLKGSENRIWVSYEDIPKYMEQALVAIEDKRFYEHKGVDWYRTAGAFVEMFLTMENSFGGSTITQQLIKNITGKDDITVRRKLMEIFGALELEKLYDKQEIIEWYLNAVYFGEGCYGVQTAAKTYFGKDVQDLSLAECAAIVGITNKPTYYDPFYSLENNKNRQETILHEMYEQGYITAEEYRNACDEELVFVRTPEEDYSQEIYSYYVEVVISDVINDLVDIKGINRTSARNLLYNAGYQIYSCYDETIQAAIDAVYNDISSVPGADRKDAQDMQSGIVIMDPYTGEIKGLSGGLGEKDANFILNRAVDTKRPPGSSIKPISVYGPATEYGIITPYTYVNDAANIHLSGTTWYPHNDDYSNSGIIMVQDALKWSLNTVSAQILDKLTPEVSYNFLINKLGVTSLVPDDCSYAPLSVGQLTNGITVREMAAAFSSFVNDGTFTYSRAYTRVTDSAGNVIIDNEPRTIKAFSDNTAHVMTYMLERVVNSGTGTEAYLGTVPVAGKTGTSGDNQDRWFVGVTPYYSCAVWTGYDIPEHMYFSGNPAAYIFNRVMAPIHKGLEYRSFTYPLLEPDTKVFGNWAEEWAEAARQEREALQNQADNNNYYPVQDDYSQYYG